MSNTDAATADKYVVSLSLANPAFVFPVPRSIPTDGPTSSAGGLDPLGQWQNISYVPYDMMHRKWQYHLLKMLRENVFDPVVEKDIDRAWKDYPKGFVAFLQDGEVPPDGKGLAKYLAKYVVSPPISVRRIESYDGKSVSYWYRDHKTKQIEHETLPAIKL